VLPKIFYIPKEAGILHRPPHDKGSYYLSRCWTTNKHNHAVPHRAGVLHWPSKDKESYHLCRRGLSAELVNEGSPVHVEAREALHGGAVLCPQQPR